MKHTSYYECLMRSHVGSIRSSIFRRSGWNEIECDAIRGAHSA
jgi:hypothetical protein